MSLEREILGEVPPHRPDMERAVLGSILMDPTWRTLDEARQILEVADFYLTPHQVVWSAIEELRRRKQPLDVRLLVDLLEERDELERAGEAAGVVELTVSVPTSANLRYYAERVREDSDRRQLRDQAARLARAALDRGTPLDELRARADDISAEVFGRMAVSSTSIEAEEWAQEGLAYFESVRNRSKPPGLSTGLHALDKITGGLRPGECTVVAARPSVGKTAIATNMARVLGWGGTPWVFVSAETTTERLALNLATSLAATRGCPISGERVRDGGYSDVEYRALCAAANEMRQWSLMVDYQPQPTSVLRVESTIRRAVDKIGARVAFVDYLQKVSGSDRRRWENRRDEVSEVSQRLVHLSRELGIHVVLLAQLNRQSELRSDKRPHMGDLRDSGQIEQDADVVVLIHRPGLADMESGRTQEGEAPDLTATQLIVAKNRNGARGTADVVFHHDLLLFSDQEGT